MKVLVTGATGFIGSYLCDKFSQKGYEIIALTRNPEKVKFKALKWDGEKIEKLFDLSEIDAVINLAGETIFSLRWSEKKKKEIYGSRIKITKALCNLVRNLNKKPEVFIQASAIGYYKSKNEIQNEDGEKGDNFLSYVTSEWEKASEEIEKLGIRRVVARLGIVLGKGGFLKRIKLPFKFFMGSVMGDKNRWISWVHIDDVIGSFDYFIKNKNLNGIFNITSPNPVRVGEFYKKMGNVLKRPCFFHIPDFLIKILMREMAKNLILVNQRIIPERLVEAGYNFKFENIDDTLRDLLIDK